jgi:hypothetical protein
VVGSIFGVQTISAANQQKTDCQSGAACTNHAQALNDHSTATTDGIVSDVGFVAGGVLLAAGVVLFLTAPRSGEAQTTGWVVAPSVTPRGGGVSLRAEF